MAITSSARAKFVNKLILLLKNTLAIWWKTLDLRPLLFDVVYHADSELSNNAPLLMWVSIGGGALPYIKVVWNFPVIGPCFWHFLILVGAHFMAQLNPIDTFFCRKKWLSLSHLVPKIVRLIFHPNLYFTVLNHFVPNFSLILFIPFFIVLRSFWSLILTKT